MNYSVYRNIAVTTLALSLVGLMAGCLEMSVSFNSDEPEATAVTSTETSTWQSTNSKAVVPKTENSAPQNPAEKNNQKDTSSALADQVITGNKTKPPGILRMSNQTNQPVRLALLARKSAGKNANAGKAKDNIPAHWDFAPQEGSEKGLLLSLPQGNLKLEKGDILVAFAQDGSRRYWGPYVVGETSTPKWDAQMKEWQLVLKD
ncbi:MAG TPA: hypothetical protein VK203_26945 [Nostocaceae cyanobacterium]|nr:hypothetical protein [Nostocaceae cyanobacterium]